MDAPILPSQTQSFSERTQSQFAWLSKHATVRNAFIFVATVVVAALALSSPSLGIMSRSHAAWRLQPSVGSREMANNVAYARSMNAMRYSGKICTLDYFPVCCSTPHGEYTAGNPCACMGEVTQVGECGSATPPGCECLMKLPSVCCKAGHWGMVTVRNACVCDCLFGVPAAGSACEVDEPLRALKQRALI